MTPTSVGMRCPECARERTRVHRPAAGIPTPRATEVIVALNVLVYLAELASGGGFGRVSGGTVFQHGALYGPAVAIDHDWWRILTSGFLHASFLHIGLNMYFIWIVGRSLEPAIGTPRFVALYLTSLVCGSLGALVLEPHSVTIGASGTAFGLLGALIVEARRRGIDLWQSGLLPIAFINFAFTLFYPGISIGGHVGGFLGGLLVGVVFDQADRRRLPRSASLAMCVALGVAAFVASLAVA
jgi:membrane associated rhomboid family serine protease